MWIIDFEASGLSRDSYPIEVGVTNGKSKYQSLIKPEDHWNYWSSASEKVHNLSRDQLLRDGVPSQTVAAELNALLEGQTVYCDCLHWDSFWCATLFSEVDFLPSFELLDIGHLLSRCEKQSLSYVTHREQLLGCGDFIQHRALDDALIIWKALQNSNSSAIPQYI